MTLTNEKLTQLELNLKELKDAVQKSEHFVNSLSDTIKEVESLVSSIKAVKSKIGAIPADLLETNKSLNLQYLKLQKKMQAENRQLTLISNIIKTKHDTFRSAIINLR